jgi:DNA-binding winged helix-turn-helix (wHTH) protein
MDKQFRQFYEFGPFRLEVDERRLWCDGAVVPLTPKAFDLLLALVAQPGHLLEKETLLKTLWPDSFVEENNLADNISKLRKALGEGENGQRFIETVPRRGYRFVAEVKSLSGASTAPAAAAESPVQTSKHLRWNRRPEVMLIAGGFVLLLLIGAGLYLRTERERVDVHELEFKGNFYLSQWTEAEIRKGLEYYQRAAALAPHAASAQAGLATAWLFLTDLYVAPREAMPQAKAAALQALQLAETEIDANISLALIKLQYDWDWAGAEAEFQHALALAPDYENAHQFYGWPRRRPNSSAWPRRMRSTIFISGPWGCACTLRTKMTRPSNNSGGQLRWNRARTGRTCYWAGSMRSKARRRKQRPSCSRRGD